MEKFKHTPPARGEDEREHIEREVDEGFIAKERGELISNTELLTFLEESIGEVENPEMMHDVIKTIKEASYENATPIESIEMVLAENGIKAALEQISERSLAILTTDDGKEHEINNWGWLDDREAPTGQNVLRSLLDDGKKVVSATGYTDSGRTLALNGDKLTMDFNGGSTGFATECLARMVSKFDINREEGGYEYEFKEIIEPVDFKATLKEE